MNDNSGENCEEFIKPNNALKDPDKFETMSC
jgi:hypothetical protein